MNLSASRYLKKNYGCDAQINTIWQLYKLFRSWHVKYKKCQRDAIVAVRIEKRIL